MSDLQDLYQEVIIDHDRRPRNFCEMPAANHRAEGVNPLCGDKLTVYVDLEGDVIRDVSFVGSGCAISKATASLMTEALKGKTVSDAEAMFTRFHDMVTSAHDSATDFSDLGKLSVLVGVREFPTRIKCASLAWHTLKAAVRSVVAKEAAQVTTEE